MKPSNSKNTTGSEDITEQTGRDPLDMIPDEVEDDNAHKVDKEDDELDKITKEIQTNIESNNINLNAIESLLQTLQNDFSGNLKDNLSSNQAAILAKLPSHIQSMVSQLSLVKKTQQAVKEKVIDPVKQKEAVQILEKFMHEVFVVGCISDLGIDEVLGFNLDKEDINEFSELGLNPLTAAIAGERSLDDISKLLKKGADVNLKQDGVSILEVALESGNVPLVQTLAVFATPETLNAASKNPAALEINGMKEFLERSALKPSAAVENPVAQELGQENSQDQNKVPSTSPIPNGADTLSQSQSRNSGRT